MMCDTGNRFTLTTTQGGAMLIMDNSNGSIVCTMANVKRMRQHTENMAMVMCDALNAAVDVKVKSDSKEGE